MYTYSLEKIDLLFVQEPVMKYTNNLVNQNLLQSCAQSAFSQKQGEFRLTLPIWHKHVSLLRPYGQWRAIPPILKIDVRVSAEDIFCSTCQNLFTSKKINPKTFLIMKIRNYHALLKLNY